VNVNVRRGLLVVGIPLLLALAWFGLRGGIGEWSLTESIGQRIQTAAQFAYGLFSLLTVASLFLTGMITRIVRASWLVAITIAGGMAPVVWGGAAWWAGLVAGLAVLLLGLLILWLLSVGARGLGRNQGDLARTSKVEPSS
jgi:hypothetical protein